MEVFTDKALPLFETTQGKCVGPLFQALVKAGLTRREALKPEGQAKVFGLLLPAPGYASLKLKGPVFMRGKGARVALSGVGR